MKNLLIPSLVALLAACAGESEGKDIADPDTSNQTALPETFWSTDSGEAVDVLALREGGATGDKIVVRGSVRDFVDGLAAFRLVEDSLLSCDERPDDMCPTPWDYCCCPPGELAQGTALVEFHDGDSTGSWSLQGFHGIDHLSEVVVEGTLRFDETRNMIIVADSIRLQ